MGSSIQLLNKLVKGARLTKLPSMGRPKKTDVQPTSVLEPRLDTTNKTMDVGGYLLPAVSLFTALLWGYNNHPSPKAREYYFWRCADLLWNHDGLPEKLFERNPWSELIIRECILNRYLAVGGAASSTKSHTLAGYGILSWMAAPAHVAVLMTSTSLGMARKRIWGSVIDLLTAIEEPLPLAIRDSIGEASYVDAKGKIHSNRGLSLIAAERSRTREAVGKIIGTKAKRLILIGDELGELSPALTTGALSNLTKNPLFEYKGLSNPASRFDAFGEWAAPKNGWESVNVEVDDEWETKWGGKYIRLDGERSPNILAGKELYPYMMTEEKLAEDKARLGENSRSYYRMVRAVFFDSDETEGIYGESELINSGAMRKTEILHGVRIVGVDPAFTNGGDRTAMWFATVGRDGAGQYGLCFDECLFLNDDVNNKAVPRTYQIAHRIKEECVKRGIDAANVAVDATGAGGPFCDVLAGEWSNQFLRVQFGGKASDRRVSANSRLTGEELYVNRVSELWFVGKEFLRTKQLSGITGDLAKEMCARRYDMVKGSALRVRIETKTDLKARLGSSPDLADAAFITLDLARQRHGLVAVDAVAEGRGDLPRWAVQPVRKTMADLDVVTKTAHAHLLDV
jgi:hypothetical protein